MSWKAQWSSRTSAHVMGKMTHGVARSDGEGRRYSGVDPVYSNSTTSTSQYNNSGIVTAANCPFSPVIQS